jgi:prepilin-type N-terminal cleavage/methylation domain-containing protein
MVSLSLAASLRSQRGYTLLELIVVLGIIAVLSALVVANMAFGDQNEGIRNSANKFVTMAKSAQSLTISSRLLTDSHGAPVLDPQGQRVSGKSFGVCTSNSEAELCGVGAPAFFQLFARQALPTDPSCPLPQPVGVLNGPSGSCGTPSAPDILLATQAIPKNVTLTPAAGVYLEYVAPSGAFYVQGCKPTTAGCAASNKAVTFATASGPAYGLDIFFTAYGDLYVR